MADRDGDATKPRTASRVGARSVCPVANTLDILGDRWSLLVIRDLLKGKRRYIEFAQSPERIATNVLSERLQRLEQQGIVVARLYRTHPPRSEYVLTPKGEALRPVVASLRRWGLRHIPGTRVNAS